MFTNKAQIAREHQNPRELPGLWTPATRDFGLRSHDVRVWLRAYNLLRPPQKQKKKKERKKRILHPLLLQSEHFTHWLGITGQGSGRGSGAMLLKLLGFCM